MSASTQDPGLPLVVQVVRQYAPARGGLEDVVANLAASLPAQGFRTRVVTCDRLFSDPDRTLPPREILDGVEVVRIPWYGSRRYPVAPSIVGEIGDADLIHVHAVDFFFDALAWSRPFHGKPMVATTHGGFFHTPKYRTIKELWFRTVTRMSAFAYQSLVCCSQSDLDLFRKIAPRRSMLVENGVDIQKFAVGRPDQPARRLATIGRFSVNKRLDRLLDTMRSLVAMNDDWRLDIIGSPSDLSPEDINALIASRGLTDHIAVHLSPENERIRELLARASIFVSASDYEGFGLVAVEAMAAGLLPVLHPNAAYRSFSDKHPDITLADFSQPEDAASRIGATFERLSVAPDEVRATLKAEAAMYSWDGVAAKYAGVYRAALGKR
ncbi:glycosyltransferase family 4 protein [Ciceribacter sp. L1K22]|uniref:glycosyltransferase family 4 protein n=1 Tax=Ciceribacter sp. L1K22 TaxID=2820275 RepID=UPI001ABDEBA1|nr:glycosyltransferase family 4 protein [Ciceribacter sp. L1K22]MBO3758133.1 glycosyltransferase family 4 protein [Ciceribacter sp. L1K22]